MIHVKLAQNVHNIGGDNEFDLWRKSCTNGINRGERPFTRKHSYNRKLLITIQRIQWDLPIYYTFLKRPLALSLGYI